MRATTFALARGAIGALTLAGCVHLEVGPVPATEAERVFRFSSFGCEGSCPVYAIAVFADGLAVFDGQVYVHRPGRVWSRLSPRAMAQLNRSALRLDLDGVRGSRIFDLDTYELCIRARCVRYDGATSTDALTAFERELLARTGFDAVAGARPPPLRLDTGQ